MKWRTKKMPTLQERLRKLTDESLVKVHKGHVIALWDIVSELRRQDGPEVRAALRTQLERCEAALKEAMERMETES